MKLKKIVFMVCIVMASCGEKQENDWKTIESMEKLQSEIMQTITPQNDIVQQLAESEEKNIEMEQKQEKEVELEVMWKDAYIEVICDIPKGLEDPNGRREKLCFLTNDYYDTEKSLYVGMHDFNADNIPELIVGDGYTIGIFTYENSEVIKIADLYMQDHWGAINGVYYWDNAIILESDGSDGSGFVGVAYKDGEYILGGYCQYHPKETLLNDKKVTYEEFCKVFTIFTSDGGKRKTQSWKKIYFVKENDIWFVQEKTEKRTLDDLVESIYWEK